MACRWRMMLVLSFSNYSWVERDVDRGRPTIKMKVSKLANLPMERYFRASYAPLGGSQIWREKASSTSKKPCFSMFRDKPPWVVNEFKGRKCHAPIPGSTRLANPNRFRGATPYTYTGTSFFFFFFFSKLNLYMWYTNNFYNTQKSFTFTKELPPE